VNSAGHANAQWTFAATQMFFSVLSMATLWMTGLQPIPSLTFPQWKQLIPIGIWSALAQSFAVIAIGAGAVSFTQIVKSAEPVFVAINNVILLKVRI
jgi:solute carrier family 35 protein E1